VGEGVIGAEPGGGTDRVPWDDGDAVRTLAAERRRILKVTAELAAVGPPPEDGDLLADTRLALAETGARVLPGAGQGVVPADVLAALDGELTDLQKRIDEL
jgi:hypothetical protein